MTTHVYVEPKDHDHSKDEYFRSCMICDGGLALCKVCGGIEGALPSECPGTKMTSIQIEHVYAGDIDFRNGAWIEGVSRNCPKYYRMYQYGLQATNQSKGVNQDG